MRILNPRSEEHTSELQSHSDLHSFPTRRSSDLEGGCCMDDVREWPACRKCQQGLLIPLSDYGRDGAPITYKAWVCSNPECGFNIRIDNGEISFGRCGY